jgi:Cd2+/Zn2+-exporting ATPase
MSNKAKIGIIVACICLALIGWLTSLFSLLPGHMSDYLAITAGLIGAGFIAVSAIRSLLRKVFGIDALATVAVIVSLLVQEYLAAAMVAIMLGGGEILEDYASGSASAAIEKLIQASPKTATVLRKGKECIVKVEEVLKGETVLVKPGGKIPVDGKVLKGQATIDQSSVTGESVPVERSLGERVFSGTIVTVGAIEIEATATAAESTYERIIKMVKEAEEHKAPIERTADKYAKYFTPVILAIGVSVYVITRDPVRLAAVFVIACPCALVLATPTAIAAGIGNLAMNGVLVRNGESLEKMGKVDTIVFDKTGTLTRGRLKVVAMKAFSGSEEDLMALAASVERMSEHPAARAILEKAVEMRLELMETKDFSSMPGGGVRASVQDASIVLGNERMMSKHSIDLDRSAMEMRTEFKDKGSLIYVSKDGMVIGGIVLADTIKAGAPEHLHEIKQSGITRTVMLTGDSAAIAKAVGEETGVDEVKADLLPEGKVEAIEEIKKEGGTVAMVGDGINDAPALITSDVGIAMGIGGTDIAIDTAGIVLSTDDLDRIPRLIRVSRATMMIVKTNIAIAMAVNLLGIGLSVFGLVSPLIASVIHESNALIGLFNSLRLLGVK